MRTRGLVGAALSLALLVGCSPATANPPVSATAPSPAGSGLHIVAGFYPLAYVAQAVTGDNAHVTSLAAPGVEPHDVELSPSAVRDIGAAALVLYIQDFQPSVDDAVGTTGVEALDAATVIELRHTATGTDPHFWLDPMLLADYGHDLATDLGRLDPAHADEYRGNAKRLYAELSELDSAFTEGLAQCGRHDIVTSHESLAYLAARYGLTQVAIAGLDPENEPSPKRVREITQSVRDTGATTIFTESSNSTSIVDTIADDAGVQTAVLSPVETVGDGEDYFSVMYGNLATLRKALDCD